MIWLRIDNRLIHGQVVEAWLPYLNMRTIYVFNNELAADILQQQILSLAISEKVNVNFVNVNDAQKIYLKLEKEGTPSLFLVKDCKDAKSLIKQGVQVKKINIGNLHFSDKKTQISRHAAVSGEDIECLNFFESMKINLDFRCVPNCIPEVKKCW